MLYSYLNHINDHSVCIRACVLKPKPPPVCLEIAFSDVKDVWYGEVNQIIIETLHS